MVSTVTYCLCHCLCMSLCTCVAIAIHCLDVLCDNVSYKKPTSCSEWITDCEVGSLSRVNCHFCALGVYVYDALS